jgi:hypothetical protein
VIFLYDFLYLLSAVLFIVGLKFLSSPPRARQGNTLAASAWSWPPSRCWHSCSSPGRGGIHNLR